MYQVEVKHYLNPEGMAYFPEWFAKVENFVSKQKGFVSIKYFIDPKNSECMRITMWFDNKANMWAWVDNPVHDEVLQDLNSYRIAPWEAKHIDHDAKEVRAHVIYLDDSSQDTPIAYVAP